MTQETNNINASANNTLNTSHSAVSGSARKTSLKGGHKLQALSAAALALPGMAQAAQPAETTISYRYTQYNESSMDENDVDSGSRARYDIDVNQYSFSGPVGTNLALTINYQDEILSGASPWYNNQEIQSDSSGNPELVDASKLLVVMSGASIYDRRQDLSVGVTRYHDGGSLSGSIGVSTEDDYKSLSLGFSFEKEYHNKQTVLSAGLSMSDDELQYEGNITTGEDGSRVEVTKFNFTNPIGGRNEDSDGNPNFINGAKASKESQSAFVSVSRILSPKSIMLGGFSYARKSGYLHDAYKAYDQRPDTRDMYTFDLSYRHYLKASKSAFHADFRYYDDSWSVTSYAYEFSLYKKWNKMQIVPSGRYYVQTSASMYDPVARFARNELHNYFSDDARLSDYAAISVGLKFIFKFKPVDWVIATEYYKAKQDFAPSQSDFLAHPALIEYTRISFGMDHRF